MRLVVKGLKEHPLVKKVKKSYYRISVEFIDGTLEIWVIRENKRNMFSRQSFRIDQWNDKMYIDDDEIPVYAEYETHPFDYEGKKLLEPFFCVQRSDIQKASFVNVRLMVHKIINKLLKEGWIDLRFPTYALRRDFELIKSRIDENRFVQPDKRISRTFSNFQKKAGLILMQHFLDWGSVGAKGKTVRDGWSIPQVLYMALQSIIGSTRGSHDITRSNIIRHMSSPLYGAGRRVYGLNRWASPAFWYSVIKNYFIRHETIYDHVPSIGSKMIAAALIGSEYTPNNPQHGIHDMGKFVECNIVGEKDEYDLAILSDVYPLEADEAIPLISKFMQRSRSIGIAIHPDSKDAVEKKFPPSMILRDIHGMPWWYYFFIYKR